MRVFDGTLCKRFESAILLEFRSTIGSANMAKYCIIVSILHTDEWKLAPEQGTGDYQFLQSRAQRRFEMVKVYSFGEADRR